jgi:hypothetical protein
MRLTPAAKPGVRYVYASYQPVSLPAVDDVRDYAFTERPWLAADPRPACPESG